MAYLDENIRRMNEYYQSHDFRFVKEDLIVKLVEDTPYYLYNHKDLMADLKKRFKLMYNPTYIWHIAEAGVSILSKTFLKFNSTIPVDELKEKMDVYISQITEENLRDSVNAFVQETEYFSGTPGALYYHHAYNNGLLEHTIQVLDLCYSMKDVVEVYFAPNLDLLTAGGILHDVGKIYCYDSNEGVISLTEIQLIQDHIIHGVKKVTEKIQSEKLDDLIHIIASHHGQKKWG